MIRTLGQWLGEEPFTLAMSSGFFGFFAHAGMLEALCAAGLRPRRVVGSSAGALVAGVFAAGVQPEHIARELCAVRREDFWDPAPGLGLLRGRRFRAHLARLVGDARLEATALPATLVVHDVLAHRPVARAYGELGAVIHASCAVPGLFHPVWLDGRPYLDGGILDRPSMTALGHAERTLYHHLSSRSPWRSLASMGIPRRDGMTSLVLDALPRSGPFRLEAGRAAYQEARSRTERALDLPLSGHTLRVAKAA
jgi:NTE family protein